MKNSAAKSGFTLLEITVAMGIFSIFLVVFIGIFSNFIGEQRRARSQQQVIDQLRFAMEVINRELRTGYGSTYQLSNEQGTAATFRNQNGSCVYLRWVDNHLERAEQTTSGVECNTSSVPEAAYAALTSSNVTVESARFDAIAGEVEDNVLTRRGFMTMIIEARGSNQITLPVRLQSTVTSRQVIPYAD